jgi:hypothetical protein
VQITPKIPDHFFLPFLSRNSVSLGDGVELGIEAARKGGGGIERDCAVNAKNAERRGCYAEGGARGVR